MTSVVAISTDKQATQFLARLDSNHLSINEENQRSTDRGNIQHALKCRVVNPFVRSFLFFWRLLFAFFCWSES